jgi:hypothetical protein
VPTIGDLTTWPVGSGGAAGAAAAPVRRPARPARRIAGRPAAAHHHLILRDGGGLDDADLAFAFGHFEFGDVRFGDEVDQRLEFS